MKGTSTDEKGNYQLPENGITDFRIVVTFLGYNNDTVMAGKKNARVDIQLFPDNKQLTQVNIKESNGSYISKINPRNAQVMTSGELYKAACCNLSESFETNASVDVSYTDAITGARQIQLLGLSGIYCQVRD